MQHTFGLDIPETLEEACDPKHTALLVYDMQVGIFRQASTLSSVTPHVSAVLKAARAAKMRIFFSRHMSLPNKLAGVSQLRTAMNWQQAKKVKDVQPYFLRDSANFALIPALQPRIDEVIFDKIGMSFFAGTPLDTTLRDCGIKTFIIVGVVLEMGIAPTITSGTDLGYVPIVVTDACGSVDMEARKRTLENISYMQTSLITDTATITDLLSKAH